jgi:threonine dehydratase
VYLPSYTSSAKVKSLKVFRPEIKFHGDDCLESETEAKKQAQKKKASFISPYNDLKIIAGQGTVGVELLKQVPELDVVMVPVGGGGLISGVAGYLKNQRPEIEIIGTQPKNSPVMYESLKAGRIVKMESKPTISDGTAGGIEHGSITFDFCKKFVDRFIILSEQEIIQALKFVMEKEHFLIEGAAALPIAGLLKEPDHFKNKNIGLILSGAKISIEKLKKIL